MIKNLGLHTFVQVAKCFFVMWEIAGNAVKSYIEIIKMSIKEKLSEVNLHYDHIAA
ncbi:hypothetical protein CLK_1621 [Clostridium botulinum A3 str. Loch Maree]|nr:hypothetical protein CLK_1621 [Clostridium botulinum A3 str. Loch Maree]